MLLNFDFNSKTKDAAIEDLRTKIEQYIQHKTELILSGIL